MPIFTGTDGDDILTGTDEADILTGGAGADILDGRGGNDTIDGGDGDDVIHGGSGSSVYNGGAGYDILTYQNWLGGGVRVELSDPFDSFRPGFATTAFGTSVPNSIERLIGSRFADVLIASFFFSGPIEGGDGDDILAGGSAQYTFIGGRGADVIWGGSNNDLIIAEGDDTIYGWLGYDTVRLSGRYADYTLSVEAGMTVLTSATERIRVVDVERFEFADTIVTGPLAATQPVRGGAGADRLVGTAGNEMIFGEAGNDVLTGGGGFDFLHGGDGLDTALYSGLTRSYTLVMARNNQLSVYGGPEGGRDDLRDVEMASFVDGTLFMGQTTAAAQVYRLYHAAFGAAPDQAELSVWFDRFDPGPGLIQLAQSFAATPDFVARFGALGNEAFVREMYQLALGRVGDPRGIFDWTSRLDAGASRASVLLAFAECFEHIRLTQTALAEGLFVEDSRTYALARLYEAAFDGPPDAEDIIAWRAELETGVSLLDVAEEFFASQDFQSRYGGTPDQAYVQQLYRLVLDREPDPEGLQTWTDRLTAGTTRSELLLIFSECVELRELIGDRWIGGIRYEGGPLFAEIPDGGAKTTDPLTLPELADDDAIWFDAFILDADAPDAFDAADAVLFTLDPISAGQPQTDWF